MMDLSSLSSRRTSPTTRVHFTALHGMRTRYSDQKAVRLSICLPVSLSVRQTRGLWQNGRKICPYF